MSASFPPPLFSLSNHHDDARGAIRASPAARILPLLRGGVLLTTTAPNNLLNLSEIFGLLLHMSLPSFGAHADLVLKE